MSAHARTHTHTLQSQRRGRGPGPLGGVGPELMRQAFEVPQQMFTTNMYVPDIDGIPEEDELEGGLAVASANGAAPAPKLSLQGIIILAMIAFMIL